MSIATFSVGPGESYRNKKTGRVTTLGYNDYAGGLDADLYEKVPTGGAVSGSAEIIADIRKAMGDMRRGSLPGFADRRFWTTPPTDIPAFVEPERPAPPKPEPDSPAVAMLRRLLKDREARQEKYQAEIEAAERAIENLEDLLQLRRADLDHTHNCADALSDEINEVAEQIRSLGGEV